MLHALPCAGPGLYFTQKRHGQYKHYTQGKSATMPPFDSYQYYFNGLDMIAHARVQSKGETLSSGIIKETTMRNRLYWTFKFYSPAYWLILKR